MLPMRTMLFAGGDACATRRVAPWKRPGAMLLLAAVVLVSCQGASVSQHRPGIFRRRSIILPPKTAPVDPMASANTAQARQLIGLFLQKGVRQPYTGEQITRLLQGMVHETRQTVKYAGPSSEE